MSTKSSGNRDGAFVMPERFSFGLEERDDQEADKTTRNNTSQKSSKSGSKSSCMHRWEELPDDLQTLANENKIIWKCHTCGEMTNTYTWRKP